jgi:hypothetical protein
MHVLSLTVHRYCLKKCGTHAGFTGPRVQFEAIKINIRYEVNFRQEHNPGLGCEESSGKTDGGGI